MNKTLLLKKEDVNNSLYIQMDNNIVCPFCDNQRMYGSKLETEEILSIFCPHCELEFTINILKTWRSEKLIDFRNKNE